VSALILANAYARLSNAPGYPWGPDQRDDMEASWGEGSLFSAVAPSRADDRPFGEWWARYERLGLGRGAAVAMRRMLLGADARHALPAIQVPTLVLHRHGNRLVEIGHGRYLARHISSARFVELDGDDHLLFTEDASAVLDEIQEFLTGVRGIPDPDRVLVTVLFTDIVASTDRVAALGDRRWRDLLGAHDAMVRRQIDRFTGRVVKTTGDGIMATFDGPARAIRCGVAIRDSARQLDLEVRVGLHTGEVENLGDDVAGVAVHIAARVVAAAEPGTVLVSGTVRDLVAGSGFAFMDRGLHSFKGLNEPWRLYEVGG
jgi:class 3 adenylate cyclase